MNVNELQSVQSRERQTDSLQQLRDSFYQEVGRFIEGLKAERRELVATEPDAFDSPTFHRLNDEIKTAESTVEAIYERRVGKLVKQASLEAAGMAADVEGLTEEEQRLFELLVERIEANRTHVLDGVIANGGVSNEDRQQMPATSAPTASDAPAEPQAAESKDGDRPPAAAGSFASEDGPARAPADESPVTDSSGPASHSPTAPTASDRDGERDAGTDQPAGRQEHQTPGGVSAADVMGGDATEDPGDRVASETQASPPEQRAAASASPPPEGDDQDDQPGPPAERSEPRSTATATATPPASSTDDAPRTGAEETGHDADQSSPVDRTVVRITADVGEIFGIDERSYHLSSEDVVTLPSQNAGPLLEKGAAERLD